MRRLAAVAVVLAFLAGAGTAYATIHGTYQGYPVVKVLVNGKELQPDVPAIIMDGRTLLPVRAVAEALGAKVEWDSQTYTARVSTVLSKEEVSSIARDLFEPWVPQMTQLSEDIGLVRQGGTTKAKAEEVVAQIRDEANANLRKIEPLLPRSKAPGLLAAAVSAAYCQWHFYEFCARSLEAAAEGNTAESDRMFKLAQQWQSALVTMDWLGLLLRNEEAQRE